MKYLIYVLCWIIIFSSILLAIFSSYISLNTLGIIISLIAFVLVPILLISVVIVSFKGNNKKINKKKILVKMENTDKFNKIYDKLYESHIKSLEELRMKAKSEEIIKILLLVFGFLSCVIGEASEKSGALLIGYLALFIYICSFVFFKNK